MSGTGITMELVRNFNDNAPERWLFKDEGLIFGDIVQTGDGTYLARYGKEQWLCETSDEAALALLEHHASQGHEVTLSIDLTDADLAA